MITVKRESDGVEREWIFRYWIDGHTLYLIRWWQIDTRSTTGTLTWCPAIGGQKPATPPDVLDEARRQFVETLKVDG